MSIAAELIDKRVIRRFLERGVIERASYQRYLDQLPDCADKCAPTASAGTEGSASVAVAAQDGAAAHAGAP